MRIGDYTKLNVGLITLVLIIFIFRGVNLAYENLQLNNFTQDNIYKETHVEKVIPTTNKDTEIEEKLSKVKDLKHKLWQIEIPKIGLMAPIANDTTQEVMRDYVGHFENTVLWKGNIGLAAHNRGFQNNYFENVKDLKTGDEIIYRTPYGEKIYEVNLYKIIEETDWSYLQETEDNRITLITCVANKPRQRLCVQAVERIL